MFYWRFATTKVEYIYDFGGVHGGLVWRKKSWTSRLKTNKKHFNLAFSCIVARYQEVLFRLGESLFMAGEKIVSG